MNELQKIGVALVKELEVSLPVWVEQSTREIYQAWKGEWPQEIADQARRAGERCATEILPVLRELMESDIAAQQTNPMSILRRASQYPTYVLKRYDVPPVQRDDYLETAFPQDVYSLIPAAFSDFGQKCHELGIAWGAAKAYIHLTERRETDT